MESEPQRRLAGRVALVTGAGQGVGRGIALALASEGARVAVVGRTRSKCDAVSREILARGGDALTLSCDVEVRDQVDATLHGVIEQWGRLDILVNNAQAMAYKSLRRLTEEDMESMWQSGPMGAFRMLQASFDSLRASRGCVVNLGSGSSILPQPTMAGYAMAKEALRVLTRVAAQEWGRYGIRVNAVCPLAESPGLAAFDEANPGAHEAAVLPHVPLGRVGDAEADIGSAVVYLCSDAAAYVTGTTLMADGGYTYLR
jgi:NAD(P)-dependent dehydrogenase (short-subunit alcohol dehydrogenase family)